MVLIVSACEYFKRAIVSLRRHVGALVANLEEGPGFQSSLGPLWVLTVFVGFLQVL